MPKSAAATRAETQQAHSPETPVPFDPSDIAQMLAAMFIGASTLFITAAIAWRIGVKPTMRALLEYRAARPAPDPQVLRRLSELEDEVRALKARLAVLPEPAPSRSLVDAPWRPSRERALSLARALPGRAHRPGLSADLPASGLSGSAHAGSSGPGRGGSGA